MKTKTIESAGAGVNEVVQAAEVLWQQLLVNGKFFAYTFQRNCTLAGHMVDFHCPEIAMVLHIDRPVAMGTWGLRQTMLTDLQKAGYHCLTLSSHDILHNFEEAVETITRHFKSLAQGGCNMHDYCR